MNHIKTLILFIIATFSSGLAYGQFENIAGRLEGSPYPVSVTPSTLYVINDWGWSESKRLTTITLMGLLAKNSNTMIYNESGVGYSLWLDDLTSNYGVTADKSYYNDFTGLITHFQYDFDGYILCDLKDNSTNVAVSLCGPMNAVAVTTEDEALMTSLGKTKLLDVRGKDEAWALTTSYSSDFSKDITCLQNEDKSLFLSDYAVFANAFQFFDSDINSSLVEDALGRMNSNKVVMGWGPDEEYTVRKISGASLQLNPADWTENLPVLSNFDASLSQHTHVTDIPDADTVHVVCFLVTDGDNFDWLLKEFYGQPKAYGSPNRGEVSIGWTISPAMCELAPTVMKYLYDQATNTSTVKDFFVASSSGIGYMNPDLFPDLAASAEQTNRFMEKADLNILNVIGTRYQISDMEQYLAQENIDAVFYYGYANYAELNGAIYIVNDKPVIGARYRLWEGFDNAETLAAKLNSQSTDAYSAAGYSLIAVHAWSFGQYVTDQINACVDQLNSNVIVVTPEEFVKRIKNKFNLPDAKNSPATGRFKVYPNPVHGNYIYLEGSFKEGDIVGLYNINHQLIHRELLSVNRENRLRIDLDNGIANGLYLLEITNKNSISITKIIIKK